MRPTKIQLIQLNPNSSSRELSPFQGATLVAINTYMLSADGHTLTIALALGGDSETAATFAFDRVDAL